MLKALLFLLIIVCFPLFLLPMMLSRFAQVGWSGLRYGTMVDVASGQDARWRHGIAADAGDAGDVSRAGVAAEDIMLRDPGFRVSALTRWAVAATALLRDSLVSGDATGTRTFMSNGLYQAHQALLDLRGRANVSCAGSWGVTEALVTGVSRSPLTEQVRVRVDAPVAGGTARPDQDHAARRPRGRHLDGIPHLRQVRRRGHAALGRPARRPLPVLRRLALTSIRAVPAATAVAW